MKSETSSEILASLYDPNCRGAWTQFCDRYEPILLSFGQRLGLDDSAARDAAQETLMAFLEGWRKGDYEPHKGRLRSWLLGIARNKILYMLRKRRREVPVPARSGTGFLEGIPDEASMGEIWEREWQQAFVQRRLQELRDEMEPRTLEAFELVSLKDWPAEKVAEQLNMSVNAILKANRRVLTKMRQFHRLWDNDE